LATTPVEELLGLPSLQPDQVTDSLHAYQIAKRGNSLRVMAEAVRWGKRGARANTISPGIIIIPLAKDELTGPRGDGCDGRLKWPKEGWTTSPAARTWTSLPRAAAHGHLYVGSHDEVGSQYPRRRDRQISSFHVVTPRSRAIKVWLAIA
jgi:NAD(P)-dependent dehydrogenase (short-subunit alcohol dehydrogenase family)